MLKVLGGPRGEKTLLYGRKGQSAVDTIDPKIGSSKYREVNDWWGRIISSVKYFELFKNIFFTPNLKLYYF